MGNLVWHEYARLVSISASIYSVWAGFWGLIYRKFFWDFVNGTLRNPGGLQPAKQDAIFVTLIVKAPVIQIFAILTGLFIIALEFPLPLLKGNRFQRSFVMKALMLVNQAMNAVFFYQGTNGALWSLIAAACYGRAIYLGETVKEAKDNRGRPGKA